MTLFSNVQHWWQGRVSFDAAHQYDDEKLLKLYEQTQKPYWFEMLFKRHTDPLFHYLLSLSDNNVAEDIAQQTWLIVIEKPERYQPTTASFRTWLFTLSRNRLIDELRRINRWQWQSIEENPELAGELESEELVLIDHPKIQETFDKALSELPFVQRESLMLQLEGFSLTDIANITGEKAETIKSRLRFARKQLKQTMEVNG